MPIVPNTYLVSAVIRRSRAAGGHTPPERPLWQNLAAGVLALVAAMGIGRFAYTPILPAMQDQFDLSNGAAGALASSNYLGYLVGAVFAAFVPISRAREALIQAGLLAVAAATILMGVTDGFAVWLLLRFVAGVGGAVVFVLVSAVVLGELSRRGQPSLSGLFYAGPGVGIAASGGLVLLLDRMFAQGPVAWRADWLVLGAFALALAFLCRAWLPKEDFAKPTGVDAPTPKAAGPKEETTKRATAGTVPLLILLGSAYFLEGAGYIVTGTFLPAIVENLPKLEGLGAGSWILVGLAAAPSAVLWTGAASRVGPVAALVAAYAAQAAGIFLPVVSTAWWAASASAVLLGGTFVAISALTLTYAREVIGERGAGSVIGLLTAVYGVGQMLGPLASARLVGDAGNFGPALVAASASVAVGGLLIVVASSMVAGTKPACEGDAQEPKPTGVRKNT